MSTESDTGREEIERKLHDRFHESCDKGQAYSIDVPKEKCWDLVGILADVRAAMNTDMQLRILLTTKDEQTVLLRFMARVRLPDDEYYKEQLGADVEIDDSRWRTLPNNTEAQPI